MRKTLLLSFLALFSFAVKAQYTRCNTYESLQDYRAKNPRAETDAQFESWLNQKIAARQGQRTNAYYTIPVIFHIVHNGEAVGSGRNISAAQIQQQLNQLNADFANLAGSQYGVAATTQIQFCLATVNAGGTLLPEPGIERIDRNVMGWTAPPYAGQSSTSYVDLTIMPNTIWDPNRYFNIWTIDLSGSLLGKATFPVSSGLPDLLGAETDTHAGVFVAYQSVGSVCTPGSFGAEAGLGRTLTHEAGHFFGLRHITGDSNCGDDYCEDTPSQDALTSGCPGAGTLNNCPISVPKMFENYMDYTNDACVNTFTANQVARMQTVMLNSPRRATLPGAGSCSGGTSNAIKFNYVCATASETRVVTACPDYRDVVVNINVQSSANGSATLSFIKSGSATDNVDYTIIPSSLTFANGESTPKTVTIRIWDDGVAESTETLTLGYTISGSGVVAGSANQSFSLTITDNDATPVISNTGSTILFSEDFSSGGVGWASGSLLATPGANVWTVSGNGGAGITGNAAHITNSTSTRVYEYTITSTSSALLLSPAINGVGKSNATLSFKYKVEGEISGSTLFDYGTIMYSLDGSSFTSVTDAGGNPINLQGTSVATTISNIDLPDAVDNKTFYLGFRWRNDNTDGTNPPFLI
ncbi:MAG TPA: M43 family zinc metalloprotease, partial [Flavisolibacter sp.]